MKRNKIASDIKLVFHSSIIYDSCIFRLAYRDVAAEIPLFIFPKGCENLLLSALCQCVNCFVLSANCRHGVKLLPSQRAAQ